MEDSVEIANEEGHTSREVGSNPISLLPRIVRRIRRPAISLALWVLFSGCLLIVFLGQVQAASGNRAPRGDPFTYEMSFMRFSESLTSIQGALESFGDSWYWFSYLGLMVLYPVFGSNPDFFFLMNVSTALAASYALSWLSYRISHSIPVAMGLGLLWIVFPSNYISADLGSLQVISLDAAFLPLLLASLCSWIILSADASLKRPLFAQTVTGVLTSLTLMSRGKSETYAAIFIMAALCASLFLNTGSVGARLAFLVRRSWLALTIALVSWAAYISLVGDNLASYYAPHEEVMGTRDRQMFLPGAIDILCNIPGVFLTNAPHQILTTIASLTLHVLVAVCGVIVISWKITGRRVTLFTKTLAIAGASYGALLGAFIWAFSAIVASDIRDNYFSFEPEIRHIFKPLLVPLVVLFVAILSVICGNLLRRLNHDALKASSKHRSSPSLLLAISIIATPLVITGIATASTVDARSDSAIGTEPIPFFSEGSATEMRLLAGALDQADGDGPPCILWRGSLSLTILNYYRLRDGMEEWPSRFEQELFAQGLRKDDDASVVFQALLDAYSSCQVLVVPVNADAYSTGKYRLYQHADQFETVGKLLGSCEFRVIGSVRDGSELLLVLERSSAIQDGELGKLTCYDYATLSTQFAALPSEGVLVPSQSLPTRVTATTSFQGFEPSGLLTSRQPGWHANLAEESSPTLRVSFGAPTGIRRVGFQPQDDLHARAPHIVRITTRYRDGIKESSEVRELVCSSYGTDRFQFLEMPANLDDVTDLEIEILQNCGDSGLITLRGLRIE